MGLFRLIGLVMGVLGVHVVVLQGLISIVRSMPFARAPAVIVATIVGLLADLSTGFLSFMETRVLSLEFIRYLVKGDVTLESCPDHQLMICCDVG